MKLVNLKIQLNELTPAEECEIEFALAAQLEDFQTKDFKIEISDVYLLMTELSNDVLHEGTHDECMMIMNSMIKYGINGDKFIIQHK